MAGVAQRSDTHVLLDAVLLLQPYALALLLWSNHGERYKGVKSNLDPTVQRIPADVCHSPANHSWVVSTYHHKYAILPSIFVRGQDAIKRKRIHGLLRNQRDQSSASTRGDP